MCAGQPTRRPRVGRASQDPKRVGVSDGAAAPAPLVVCQDHDSLRSGEAAVRSLLAAPGTDHRVAGNHHTVSAVWRSTSAFTASTTPPQGPFRRINQCHKRDSPLMGDRLHACGCKLACQTRTERPTRTPDGRATARPEGRAPIPRRPGTGWRSRRLVFQTRPASVKTIDHTRWFLCTVSSALRRQLHPH